MSNNYICAVDIGSHKISASAARIKKKRITALFSETVDSKGVRKGTITNSPELSRCIERLLKKLKAKSGMNIKAICVNISGQDVIAKHSRAILPLAERGNKVITSSDMHKVIEQARILGLGLEEEIIHQIPFSYSIDSKNDILEPLGLYSHRLEVDLYLICAKASSVQSLSRAVNQSGYEIKSLFLSGMATSRAVFGEEIRTGTNILCDIGSDITELLIFSEGRLRSIEIIPLGGADLTEEIRDALKIPFDLAEEVKKTYCNVADSAGIQEDKEILIKKDNAYKPIKQKLLSEAASAKTKLICRAIKEAIEKTASSNQVNGFVCAGRAALLEGFLETLENTLGIPVKLGRVIDPALSPFVYKEANMSGQKYLTYLTSLGMLCEALQPEADHPLSSAQSSRNLLVKAINKIKEVYQEYF